MAENRRAPEGVEAFVLARGDALHSTAYLLTRDHGLAEDLVQTSLAKAWSCWGRICGDPEPYVRAILVNTFSSWWRRKWNGESPTEVLPEPAREDSSEAVTTRLGLLDALACLPRRQRAVIVLRFSDDLTEAQTASAKGTSVGTVKSQTFKALAALRIDPALAGGTSSTPSTTLGSLL